MDHVEHGRTNQFTVFGVHVLNPVNDNKAYRAIKDMARDMVTEDAGVRTTIMSHNVNMESNLYTGKGFSITKSTYGTSRKIVNGGKYTSGMGFEIGIDRIVDMKGKREINIAL